MRDKPCKFAVDNGGDDFECGCYRKTHCWEQRFDYNPDGSVNVVICGYNPEKEDVNNNN